MSPKSPAAERNRTRASSFEKLGELLTAAREASQLPELDLLLEAEKSPTKENTSAIIELTGLEE